MELTIESLNELERKNARLIKLAIEQMQQIEDPEHGIEHVKDVVGYAKELMLHLAESGEEFDPEAVIISIWWHDVGRKTLNKGHERLSAELLEKQMKEMEYDEELIKRCFDAIEFHKWSMTPQTVEGHIVRDADKLGFVGELRWAESLRKNKNLGAIIELLPNLRNEYLHYDISREIYDRDIINLIDLLSNTIYSVHKKATIYRPLD